MEKKDQIEEDLFAKKKLEVHEESWRSKTRGNQTNKLNLLRRKLKN